MRKIFFLFVLLLFCGCHDDYWELGDSYVYDNGYIYYLVSDNYSKGIHEHYEELVPFEVQNFGFDEQNIIAYQKPDSAEFTRFSIDIYKDSADSIRAYQANIDSLESVLDSMLRIQNCYWIISKKNKKVFGPMSEFDFNRRRSKMGINLSWKRKWGMR